jgi:hypothetical protein
MRSKAIPRTELSLTYWVIDLASELVFVGDDGTTEARGPSHREGIEFAMRVKILDWLTFSGDVTAAKAEFDTGGAVPLAPLLTSRADLTARLPWGLSSSLAMRFWVTDTPTRSGTRPRGAIYCSISPRAIATSGSRRSSASRTSPAPSTVKHNSSSRHDWPESRRAGVPDIHYTPGNPRTVLGGLAVRF